MKTLYKFLSVLLILALALTGCGAPAPAPSAPPAGDVGTFTLTFITIGKGDAFLLTSPEGRHYLVDTGKAEDYQQIARTLRVKGIDTLDGIFVTHGHKDHAGCLDTLLGAFPTGAVYVNGHDDVSYTEILPDEICARRGVELVGLAGGEVLDLGGMTAEVWLPAGTDPVNANNNSLVLRVLHGNLAFLLMGDAELEEEALLLNSEFDLRADLLKLGHHGEDDASSPAFLDRVKPKIGLIAGNAEENPESVDPAVTALLEERHITPYYSECDGLAWEFLSDGTAITPQLLEDTELPAGPALSFAEVDRPAQRVSIRNDGDEPADLTGCMLISQRGDEHYLFPAGTMLEPGAVLTVACEGYEKEGDLIWPGEAVWRKKRDEALLYDHNMNLLDEDRP